MCIRDRYFSPMKERLNGTTVETAKVLIDETLHNVRKDLGIFDSSNKPVTAGIRVNRKLITKLDKEAKRVKINEYIKQKQELEARLTLLSKDIVRMRSGGSSVVGRKRKTLLIKDAEEFEKIKEQASKFIKKIRTLESGRKKTLRLLEVSKRHRQDLEYKEESRRANTLLRSNLRENKQSNTICVIEEEYLYKRLEDKYKLNVLIPSLEKRKHILAMRRDRFRPANWEVIHQHERKYDRRVKEHSEERERQLAELRLQDQQVRKMQRANLKWIMADMQERLDEDMKVKHKLELREKMQSYSRIIKDIVKVRRSPKKEAELKRAISQLRHPVRERRDMKKLYNLSESHQRGRNTLAKRAYAVQSNQPNTCTNTPNFRVKIRSIGEISTVRSKPIDYLTEQRRKRESGKQSLKANSDWVKDLENPKLGQREKCDLVMQKASKMENEARIKERLLLAKGGPGSDLKMNENITDMLVEAVKAKLAVLDSV
eukprot:TRINITY_DN13190_c0_g1_i2.p1 TRINITY_DN13190_c0_g1~~TRINITY_DN13190_c0_g1_i2.p1  ORF type:complete len:486 (-),score=114.27 TRINITY_DN13190_c0_g1_i2:141-1598(-)